MPTPTLDDLRKDCAVRFSLEVGEVERHSLEYHFNQLLGCLVIKVDERPYQRSVRLFNEPVHEVHVVVLGEHERYTVRIEKQRKPLFGHRNRVFVNNRLLKVVEGLC
jgi:hypothetical protein